MASSDTVIRESYSISFIQFLQNGCWPMQETNVMIALCDGPGKKSVRCQLHVFAQARSRYSKNLFKQEITAMNSELVVPSQ